MNATSLLFVVIAAAVAGVAVTLVAMVLHLDSTIAGAVGGAVGGTVGALVAVNKSAKK